MRIIYLVPDNAKPSWGVGVIYHHVLALKNAGFDAYVMHQQKGFKLNWLSFTVPMLYASVEKNNFKITDVLVLPEVMVGFPRLKKIACRKIVFIQNVFYLFESMPEGETHKSLGINQAIFIMPHMRTIIENRIGISHSLIPPLIADYFFKDRARLHQREKTIVVYPKNTSLDYGILIRFIKEAIAALNHKSYLQRLLKPDEQWKLIELQGKSHIEVAAIMKEANFFISLNTIEAFNTSVPEAMAAGCINFCYTAFGPEDFLKNNRNAYVFPNNYIYPLIEKLVDVLNGYDGYQEELKSIRLAARETADAYTTEALTAPLTSFYKNLQTQNHSFN